MRDYLKRIEAIASEQTKKNFAVISITGDVNDADYITEVTEYDLSDAQELHKFEKVLEFFEEHINKLFEDLYIRNLLEEYWESEEVDDDNNYLYYEVFPSEPICANIAHTFEAVQIIIWNEDGIAKLYELKR